MKNAIAEKINKKNARVCIIGLGYVGLPTAVIFAEKGFPVIGCEKRESFVKAINSGKNPLEDLDLNERIRKLVKSKRFTATTNTKRGVKDSDIVLVAVPTPTKEGFEPDLQYIISAGEDIAEVLRKGQLIILESTVYPGVTEDVLKPILEKSGLKSGKDFGLVFCPERYNPGDSKHTIDKVVRILGGIDREWAEVAAELYGRITQVHIVPNIKTAEMAKIIENTQRDLNIALMNEIALICERMGLDVMEVIAAAATKWNFNVYYPGGGVGGHCLPKDPWYLIKAAEKSGYHAQIITAGRRVNDYMPTHVLTLLVNGLNSVGKSINQSRIVILGLSYKENVGDIRNAPALKLIKNIKEMNGTVFSIDPFIDAATAISEFNVDKHYSDFKKAIEGADAIVLMTAHEQFKSMKFSALKKDMNEKPVIIDCRRVLDLENLEKCGFITIGLGKAFRSNSSYGRNQSKYNQ